MDDQNTVDGNPPELTPADQARAVMLAEHMNDLLIGVSTHSAVWALGYTLAVGAFFQEKANRSFGISGAQFIADASTVALGELRAQLEAEEQENGS